MAHITVNLRLDTEADKDIVDFLEDKPKTFILKLALRQYMSSHRDAFSDDAPAPQKPSSVAKNDSPLGKF